MTFTGFSKTGTQLARKWSGHDLNFNIRVWSWLRMNAGGVLNTCKSNEENLIESFGRISFFLSGGRVSNVWATCPILGNNHWKRWLIPHVITEGHPSVRKGIYFGIGWARIWLASWWDNSPPRRRSVADLRGWSATLGLRHGPDSYGRQQWGILHNGGNPDAATPREGWRFSDRKLLSTGKKQMTVPD